MLRISDCRLRDEVFSHVDLDGTVRHFNATKMLEACYYKAVPCELITAQMDLPFVDFILKNRGVERYKLDRLCEPFLSIPLLFADFPNTSLLVDGHHRYVRLAQRGDTEYHAFTVPDGYWQKFLIDM